MKFGTALSSEYLVRRATGLWTYDRVEDPVAHNLIIFSTIIFSTHSIWALKL